MRLDDNHDGDDDDALEDLNHFESSYFFNVKS